MQFPPSLKALGFLAHIIMTRVEIDIDAKQTEAKGEFEVQTEIRIVSERQVSNKGKNRKIELEIAKGVKTIVVDFMKSIIQLQRKEENNNASQSAPKASQGLFIGSPWRIP